VGPNIEMKLTAMNVGPLGRVATLVWESGGFSLVNGHARRGLGRAGSQRSAPSSSSAANIERIHPYHDHGDCIGDL